MSSGDPSDDASRVATHYRGNVADAYFAHQQPIGEIGGELDARKFQPVVDADDVLVDFGCGTGAILDHLSARRKIGIEVSALARSAAAARGIETVGSAGELAAEIADVVISNHALEHTLRPLDELRELHRVLRPGGKLVVWLPLDDWRRQRTTGSDPDHHLYTWTPRLLRNLLAEAGFEVRECRVVAHAWPPFTSYAMRLPRPLFDRIALVWSVLRQRRQLTATATRP